MLLAAAMFINNNSPSLNRQLLIRWAAKEINYESSFFCLIWDDYYYNIIIIIIIKACRGSPEVRQPDLLTVFKHPAVQHPSFLVRSHETVDKAREWEIHKVTNRLWSDGPAQFSAPRPAYIWKANFVNLRNWPGPALSKH